MRLVLMYSLGAPSPDHLQRLRAMAPDLEVVVASSESEACEAAVDAEVIFGHRYLRQCLPFTTRLKWVQSSAGSVDRLPLSGLAKRGVALTRSTIDSDSVAMHALTLAWCVTRALPEACENQKRHIWEKALSFAPPPRSALVIGLGPVGTAIADRLQKQGIRVTGAKRTGPDPLTELPCDRLLVGDQWRDALPDADWCFLALSHTRETRLIFDEAALRSLPKHAVLVNVGRGETLDTGALTRVLNDGHLTGAALDVVADSPLAADHPLWEAPRLLITPHIASHHPGRNRRLERYFEQQLARYLAGEPLHDLVDLGPATAETPVPAGSG